MSDLSSEEGVNFQLKIWKYAIAGDICNTVAMICERREPYSYILFNPTWDHNIQWLNTQWIAYGDELYHHPPEHWCLPWVTEQRIKNEMVSSS